jgi:hypothetical protein
MIYLDWKTWPPVLTCVWEPDDENRLQDENKNQIETPYLGQVQTQGRTFF